ncbi:sorting nexin-41 [Coprinopsis cinerea okayama7|uniref:Sorting nexin-41 n=1 Tax=Coprinopsis cinerea (strain Okayama-7 / 130 / ATCC MYA-4618 / FGSC 9003) TaxID=240176 RepID=A8NAB2_COPC7|nr:sorting nexin-41 [Coprinopsis cinerea okayama7\|eukprot:XP_001831764.1 sorting nexin-41 [Coprinopsis cinerea okayama7\
MDMEGFEDENPFEEVEHINSETSSVSKDAMYDQPSPQTDFASQPTSQTDRPPFPSAGSHRQHQVHPKTDYCCSQDRYLHQNDDFEIRIVDAQKTSVNSTSPYITYVIRTGTAEARHRYSEFESLRESLVKLYPTLIIPPIPSKQTIGDYAIKQGKAKEDAGLISRRKRMLETFLNRLARHPILSNEHVFHRFLEGEVSWNEVLNSPPISNLPKNILKAPSHDPTDQTSLAAYSALPNPSAAHPLRRPDQRFLDSEAFTIKFANHMMGPMEKVSRRVVKRWKDYAQDQADLGAVLNGFSLNENDELGAAIEKTGQAVDVGYVSTTKLLQDIEQNWQEPLQEYSQFASIIKKLLAYRHQKHVQFEMTQDMLDNKREQLEELEKSEREAKRLEEALGRGRASSNPLTSPTTPSEPGTAQASVEGSETHESETASTRPSSTYIPPHPGSNPAKRRVRAPGMGFLNALSYSLHGMMDVDPETARRNSITKTRESISTLEDALHLAARDLKYSSSTIQADLDRFQRQKVADLREMGIAMAIAHRDWCKKNLEAWEEAKREIEKIPDHPNKDPTPSSEPEPSKVPPHVAMFSGTSTSSRRDSNATVNGR